MCTTDFLRQTSLFADLSDDELAPMNGCLGRRVFAKDTVLFGKGSPAQCLYVIRSGAVRIFALSGTGHDMTLAIYGAGECFGETALLDGNIRSTGAMALAKTIVFTIGRSDFIQYMDRHPQVARRVMALLAHRVEQATTYAENLAFLDVTGRVAAALLDLVSRQDMEEQAPQLNLHMTQTELASWVCASRERVNKVLHAFREEGLITIAGHTFIVQDISGLRDKLNHSHPT